MTRQGVRWRFQRLLSDIYVSAFETILFIEKTFGTQLREHATRISRERYASRSLTSMAFVSASVTAKIFARTGSLAELIMCYLRFPS